MTSQTRVMIPAIASFLETESLPYKDVTKANEISWNYPFDEHSAQINPQGMVAIARTRNSGLNKRSEIYLNKIYSIAMRLLISETSHNLLLENLLFWEDLITSSFIPKLKSEGITGTFETIGEVEIIVNKLFLGINWINSEIVPVINQDRGGTGAVLVTCEWQSDLTLI